jgi:hypothetical protein
MIGGSPLAHSSTSDTAPTAAAQLLILLTPERQAPIRRSRPGIPVRPDTPRKKRRLVTSTRKHSA